MSKKVGPYGSHYGTGCYTKNCRLAQAAACGVKAPPPTYKEAYFGLEQAYSRVLSSHGDKKAAEQDKNALAEAKLVVESTPEGIRELKNQLRNIKDNPLLAGLSTMFEDSLQKAQNRHDLANMNFRLAVFNSLNEIRGKDLQYVTECSSQYKYDKETLSVVDSKNDNKVFVKFFHAGQVDHENPPVENRKHILSVAIRKEVEKRVANSPTASTRIIDEIDHKYVRNTVEHPNGETTETVLNKKGIPLAKIYFDKNKNFLSGEWADKRNPGALIFPERNPISVLQTLRGNDLESIPPFPA